MGSSRGNRLCSGKAQMAHQREQAYRTFHQEEIEGYYDWAARRSGNHPPLKIMMHGGTTLGTATAEPMGTKHPTSPAIHRAPADTRVPAETPTAAGEQACVTRPDQPVRMLKLRPMAGVGRRRERFSYGRLACGFALGTAAALLAVWLVDIALT